MADTTHKPPEFFEERTVDPVAAATGPAGDPQSKVDTKVQFQDKRKAGFYLSKSLLDRFNRKFYELKLDGAGIENKSALLELALSFALDDMDKGDSSQVLKRLPD